MKLLTSISLLLVLACPYGINERVLAKPNIPSFATAQNKTSALERALNRDDLKAAVPQIEATWENQYEGYFKTNFVNRTISDRAISGTLNRLARTTGRKTALIYLLPGQQQLEIVVIFPGRKPIHRRVKQANNRALLAKVQEFRNALTIPSQRNTNRYLPVSKQLYQWIIAPIESDLKAQKINTLMFCAGVGLRTMPLAALHDGKRFLVEKYGIGRIPAFILTNATFTSVKNAPILAMGASEFSSQNSLPAVPVELSLVTQNRRQNRSFLNQEFTLNNLQSQLQQQPFRVLHLATHANFQSGTSSNSYVQFWNTRLQLNQIRQLGWQKIPVELLVLSACETAIGDRDAELGFAGLAVGAGVKSAIASLWFVSDEGTLALMSQLYPQLRTSPTKAEALRQAQIAMIRGQVRLEKGQLRTVRGNIKLPPQLTDLGKRNLAHPYYWSAFTIVGSPW
ncbi:CHAT domain-containing protein [Synechocystis sp. PCC 7509]|uniref:CHAT domain-containing protein n=1 Tax=Synechocystis sp. PCC 7509 TaxID=927677 RepID=UPI0002AC9EB4|nr:CHAT domain-containing protein [Synechocystis sp. PCC 7509]